MQIKLCSKTTPSLASKQLNLSKILGILGPKKCSPLGSETVTKLDFWKRRSLVKFGRVGELDQVVILLVSCKQEGPVHES